MAASTSYFTTEFVICGYHEYKNIWEVAFGEVSQCQRERANRHDPFVVAVVIGGNVVRHVTQKLSAICDMLLY